MRLESNFQIYDNAFITIVVHLLEKREMTMPRKRYFTVEEANRLIPKLEQYIGALKSLRLELEAVGAILSPLFEIVHHNGGHPKTPGLSKPLFNSTKLSNAYIRTAAC